MHPPQLFLLLLAAPALVQPVLAQPAGPPPAAVVADMPRELRFWQRAGAVADYETRPGGAGFGASVRYEGIQGLDGVATVYVYDRGQPRRPEGAEGDGVVAELDSALAEVRGVAATGRYALAAEPRRMTGGRPEARDSARCAVFPLRQPDGQTTQEGLCVTVHARRYLKTRVTLRNSTDTRLAGVIAFALMSETVPGFGPPPR